jgi:hypothetical protein
MKTGSGIKNMVKYRLTGTPDGNLLVSFYHLDVFDQQAVNWRIAEQLVDEKMGPEVLYEGNLNNNTHYQPAIFNLLQRVEVYVNCVRIERTN